MDFKLPTNVDEVSFISNLAPGLVVPIPTFPPAVKNISSSSIVQFIVAGVKDNTCPSPLTIEPVNLISPFISKG